MSILPEGEQLRKAIKWISDTRIEDPKAVLFVFDRDCLPEV